MAAWDVVCSPKHLGGLEVKNLRLMNLALRMRWLWLEKEEIGKPWRGLDFTLLPEAEELFKAATTCVLGDGKLLKFCTDRWLDNTSISESAPSLWSFVEPARKNDTVADALEDHAWTSSFRGVPSVQTVVEFVDLWAWLRDVALAQNEPDRTRWKLTTSYSAPTPLRASPLGPPKRRPAQAFLRPFGEAPALILVWAVAVSQPCPHSKFETRQNLINYIYFIKI
jgi:hypothetical protein